MSTTTKKKAAPAVSKIDLSGLSKFSLQEVMDGGLRAAGGRPLEIPLDEIIEDPQQARGEGNPGFSTESLAELAESISEGKGVKTPISVRSKNAEGKHVINHGARRYRASKLAGLRTINAFIDDSHDDYDQAVENIQREAFTPMEIALFIQKRERMGDERATIAKRLGKSRAFVTRHAVLLDLPASLRAAYDSGRCQDSLTLYNLANLAKEHSDEVARFVETTPEITRAAVEDLKVSLHAQQQDAQSAGDGRISSETDSVEASKINAGSALEQSEASRGTESDQGKAEKKVEAQTPRHKPAVGAGARGQKAVVMVGRKKGQALFVLRVDLAPSALHLGWIEDPQTGKQTEVELADLRIDSIVSK